MWQHRNGVLHHPSHPWRQKLTQDLNSRIEESFALFCEADYLLVDRRLFLSTAEHMLQHYSEEQKQQWLESVAMARMRSTQTHDTSMTSSRLCMKNWLLQSTTTVGAPTGAATTATTATDATDATGVITTA
jgi:hypothetical protein